jgi:hypothetical protein
MSKLDGATNCVQDPLALIFGTLYPFGISDFFFPKIEGTGAGVYHAHRRRLQVLQRSVMISRPAPHLCERITELETQVSRCFENLIWAYGNSHDPTTHCVTTVYVI